MARVETNSILGYIRGVSFIFLVFHSSYFGAIFLLSPFLPFVFVAPKLAKKCLDLFIWMWKIYCVALYEFLFDTKVTVVGDLPKAEDCTLIVMNHRTRFDWLYLFSLQVRYASVRRFTISLKNIIKYAPGLGWAMQMAGYIFLKRKWEEDEAAITRSIKAFKELDFRPQILYFPEGTDLTPNTKARSDQYAKKNNLPAYNFVLHPRTTGFVHIAQQMKKADLLGSLVDVTIAYPGRIAQNESDILKGKFPTEICFFVKTYPVQDISMQGEDLETWCKDCWDRKEAFLTDFYEKKSLSPKAALQKHEANEDLVTSLFMYAWVWWGMFEIFISLLLWFYPVLWWYVLLVTAFCIFVCRYTAGFGLLIASALNC